MIKKKYIKKKINYATNNIPVLESYLLLWLFFFFLFFLKKNYTTHKENNRRFTMFHQNVVS
jgi:hypothetical protein